MSKITSVDIRTDLGNEYHKVTVWRGEVSRTYRHVSPDLFVHLIRTIGRFNPTIVTSVTTIFEIRKELGND